MIHQSNSLSATVNTAYSVPNSWRGKDWIFRRNNNLIIINLSFCFCFSFMSSIKFVQKKNNFLFNQYYSWNKLVSVSESEKLQYKNRKILNWMSAFLELIRYQRNASNISSVSNIQANNRKCRGTLYDWAHCSHNFCSQW